MTSSAETTSPAAAPAPDAVGFRPPAWAITAASVFSFFALWEWFGRDVNPVFGSYPTAIFEAFIALAKSGKLLKALIDSLQPFLAGYGLAVVIGVPLGLLAASRPDSLLDRTVTSIASLGIAVPNFWLGMILVSWLALEFGWFPATGSVPFKEDPLKSLHHALLPALALAAGGVAEVSRQLRSSMVEFLSSPPVRTLHAKGLAPRQILWKHGLKNVGVNLLTVATLLFNRMLAATVVVEAVFAIPGMGNLIVNGAVHRDLPVVQGVVFVMVLVVITVNLIADVLYTVLDPRIA